MTNISIMLSRAMIGRFNRECRLIVMAGSNTASIQRIKSDGRDPDRQLAILIHLHPTS